MAEITAALVKELREKCGAGMMDCKKALSEVGGDMEAAIDWLRKKGLAQAAKKAGRTAAEGLVGAAVEGTSGALVEINAETDFVARNDLFQGLVEETTRLALQAGGDIEKLASLPFPGAEGRTVAEQITHLIATIGENMNLRRTACLSVEKGVVSAYVHSAVRPGLGKIGVLVALSSEGDREKLDALGRQIAMHVAAANPQYLAKEHVEQPVLDREKAIHSEKAKAEGKPENIIEKMLEGRIRKFLEEIVLLEQIFVVDGETKINKVLENAAKDVGAPVELAGFVRFQLGEGIEKEVTDFAAEVAAAVGG
ncbi:elongation factor Ts [Phaeovibrio sulfidiphilus]|uniref:Elongation factor Ts n=1 Tax=Phaeovibrio sulfidiphilus TaxID=1220600 RepID=A0A8J6YGT8_9PROT|nr:translation elongation factor Ts [Phaeovibrio sulfidiphilus]MBE1236051.1 elongation factor Ts [Phaeovibrio sulfidiphilus]